MTEVSCRYGGDQLNQAAELMRENEILRERLARLSEASLRITEDLDLDTVLRQVVDGACLLTGARYGVIVLHDPAGVAAEFLSSGMSDEETDRLWVAPGWSKHFEYLSMIPGPMRVPDLLAHIESLGLPELRPPVEVSERVSFLAFPVLLRGERVGSIFLAEKQGEREFVQEDEETLALFASQAALAIANARRHREECLTRANLETLIDTSPVGVVVLDPRTGDPVSINREARRILGSLREPDESFDHLRDVLTIRRNDGQEISLGESPVEQLLRAAEMVWAEEVILKVPNGRSVTVLLNATPIRSSEGEVESFVVILQDMTPLEELERVRADFLAMVSHELRAPLTSIKGSAATVLGSTTDMDPSLVRQFFRIIEDQADRMNDLVADLLDVARIETGALSVSPEPAEVTALVDRARSAVESAGGGIRLQIDIEPDLPLVLADRRRVVQVLGNLFANAAQHSPQSSVIRVSATRRDVYVAVSVSDEGRGIPAERLPHLFRKFYGTQPEERGGSAGLGLAICKGIVEAHGGRIWAESDGSGLGAQFTFTLPTIGEAVSSYIAPLSTHPARRPPDESDERTRVLAVDDDPQALRYIRDILVDAGYDPVVTGDPDEALRFVDEERPRLALLDLMLPDTDGVELMRDILEIVDVPVIFLSAYGREDHVARAFDMGAADYVVKPFSPTELAARIRAALRRREVSQPLEPYVCGDLVIDYAQRRVTLGGRLVSLASMEYRMLAELAANAGRVLSYDHLLRHVWRRRSDADVRPMRTIVSKLRRKLGDNADNPTYIFTEPRTGYRMPPGSES